MTDIIIYLVIVVMAVGFAVYAAALIFKGAGKDIKGAIDLASSLRGKKPQAPKDLSERVRKVYADYCIITDKAGNYISSCNDMKYCQTCPFGPKEEKKEDEKK